MEIKASLEDFDNRNDNEPWYDICYAPTWRKAVFVLQ